MTNYTFFSLKIKWEIQPKGFHRLQHNIKYVYDTYLGESCSVETLVNGSENLSTK